MGHRDREFGQTIDLSLMTRVRSTVSASSLILRAAKGYLLKDREETRRKWMLETRGYIDDAGYTAALALLLLKVSNLLLSRLAILLSLLRWMRIVDKVFSEAIPDH